MSKFHSESCHYYYPDGTGCFEVPKKSGGGTRPTTIRDARELNLLPSVTTLLSVWPRDAITNYRLEQLLAAATSVKRQEDEPEALWHSRIIAVSELHRNNAARIGSGIHEAIEGWLNGRSLNDLPHYEHVKEFSGWFVEQTGNARELLEFSERQLLNLDHGYCGTADLCFVHKDGRKVLADIKNQSVKNGKAAYYDTWVMQLAAYDKCGVDADEYASIVINRDNPEPPHVRYWTPEEREAGWRRFLLCKEVWSEYKGYRYQAKQIQEAA